jgi:hypothetical protein
MATEEERAQFEEHQAQRIHKLLQAIDSRLGKLEQSPERDAQIYARIE